MNETTGKIPKRKYLSNVRWTRFCRTFTLLSAGFLIHSFLSFEFQGSRKPADIYSVKGLAEHGQSDWDVPSTNLNVYIYDDPVFFPDLCRNQSSGKYPRSYYFDVMDLWLEQLHSHPSRVKIPQKASKIFVPFNVDDSFAAGTCKGTTHYDRMQNVIDYLLKSDIYLREFGKDHIWPIGHYRLHFRNGTGLFNSSMPSIISNMTISSFIDWRLNLGKPHFGIDIYFKGGKQVLKNERKEGSIWRIMQYWRCTIVTPIFTMPSAWAEQPSFESWKKRNIFIHYRGKGRNCSSYSNWKNPNDVRYAVNQLKDVIPDSLFSHDRHTSEEGFGEELRDSKFCLSIRCDDPLASRFYDAVAAGCIPVIISEGWMLAVAPFSEQINYSAFSIHVPESLFWYDPVAALRFVYNYPESYLRTMYKHFLEARKVLLWQHPQSKTSSYALQSASLKCSDHESEYIGQKINSDDFSLPRLTDGYFSGN